MSNHPEATGSYELWIAIMRRIIGRRTADLSLLDLCCCECTTTRQLGFKKHVGVDVIDWKERPDSVVFRNEDIFKFFSTNKARFDVSICSDGIEHLSKQSGLRLLVEMVALSDAAILFTPLGDYMVEAGSCDPKAHKSGWQPEEFEALGFQTETYPNWHPTLNCGAFFAWRKSTLAESNKP